MLLKKNELLICLQARGHRVDAAAVSQMDEEAGLAVKKHLQELKFLEQDPRNQESYRFSAYAQVLLDTIGKPEVWLEVSHLEKNIKRSLYLQDAYYVCVEELGENVAVDLLPSLPVFIGGYASMLKDLRNTDAEGEGTWDEKNQLITIGVHCADEQFLMEIDRQGITRQTGAEGVSFVRHSQESGTNAVTMWMLNALRQMKERTA